MGCNAGLRSAQYQLSMGSSSVGIPVSHRNRLRTQTMTCPFSEFEIRDEISGLTISDARYTAMYREGNKRSTGRTGVEPRLPDLAYIMDLLSLR